MIFGIHIMRTIQGLMQFQMLFLIMINLELEIDSIKLYRDKTLEI